MTVGKTMSVSGPRPLSVLIVDPDLDTVDSLATLVGLWGHLPWTAQDGETAMKVARDHCPDVVILDIGLGDMNCWDLVPRLREVRGVREALFVVVTAWASPNAVHRTSQAGCEVHLSKPADPEFLRCLLARRQQENKRHES